MKKCPNGHEVNGNLRFCPKCGAELKDNGTRFCKKCGTERKGTEKFCSKCGTPFEGMPTSQPIPQPTPSYDATETSTDYRKIIIPIVIGLVILALIGGGWYGYKEYSAYNEKKQAREKFVADSLEKARKDSIEAVKQKEEKERLEKEKKLKMEACLNYVKKFYRDYEKTNQDEDFLRKHCTPNAIRILEEAYDYDCEGSCLATWIFFYEAGSDAELVKREFVAKDENTCVVNNINNYNGTYSVTIGIVEENGKLKINSISTNYY